MRFDQRGTPHARLIVLDQPMIKNRRFIIFPSVVVVIVYSTKIIMIQLQEIFTGVSNQIL